MTIVSVAKSNSEIARHLPRSLGTYLPNRLYDLQRREARRELVTHFAVQDHSGHAGNAGQTEAAPRRRVKC